MSSAIGAAAETKIRLNTPSLGGGALKENVPLDVLLGEDHVARGVIRSIVQDDDDEVVGEMFAHAQSVVQESNCRGGDAH